MTPAIKLYFIVMGTALLCDWFDRLFAWTAIRLDVASLFPDRPICWGVIQGVRLADLVERELRFFQVRIPFLRTWGDTSNWMFDQHSQGFRSHRLIWIEGKSLMPENHYLGWRIDPPLPR